MGLLGSRQVIGVDLGHSSVKVVGLSLGKEPTFLGCKEVPTDPKYLQKTGFTDPEAVALVLTEALKSAAPQALKSKEVYTSLPESLIFRKIIELPLMENKEELGEAVRLEATQYLPEALENMEVDYQPLTSSQDGKLQQIMLVAVNKSRVLDYQAVFKEAKLSLKALDVEPAALGRAVFAKDEKGAYLLVDIGSEDSSISVYDQGAIWVTGTVNVGGNVIRDPDSGEVLEEEKEERLKRLALSLTDEIDHVLKFYSNRVYAHKEVKGIRLTGGGSMIAGMQEALQKQQELKVLPGESIVSLPPFCDRRFLGAIGNALYPLYEGGK